MSLYADLALRLAAALAIGAAIGLERTFHGRPAGFRTYALVCLGPALLMSWGASGLTVAPSGDVLAANSRVAQGVMTGIGFLGAGVIFKEGLTVHGLTSAASIWATAAIGLLVGAGVWAPAILGFLAVLFTLSLLRWAEDRMPRHLYFELVVKVARGCALEPADTRALVGEFGFSVSQLQYKLDDGSDLIEFRLSAEAMAPAAADALAGRLRTMPEVVGFEINPMGQ
jgi:putative Mg2+ transporter-C (MgtC) family protein